MTAGPVRLGIVGCGAVTRKCHLPALPAVPALTLTALVDSDPGRAAGAARLAARPEGTVLVAAALDDALDSIDAALVCTSNASHAGVAARLLRAGKHVLAEKPLAVTAGDCDLLAGLAGAHGAVLAAGHVRRLFPVAVWVRDLLARGVLGRPERVRWREGEPFGWPVASAAAFQPEAAGGGVLIDIGVHVFDLLLSWFGPDARVAGYADDWAGGVESEASVRLLLAGGAKAEVTLSRQRPLGSFCEITGTGGVLRAGIGLPAGYEIRYRAGGPAESGTVPVLPPAAATWRGLYERQLRRFAAAIRDGTPPLAGAADGRRAVALVQRCYAARGRPGGGGRADRGWTRFEAPPGPLPHGRVAVTGATGFVGARLVEALAAATDARVLALAHGYPRLARLSPLSQERLAFAVVDLGAPGGLAELLAGVDTVVHCAYGSRGSDAERWRTTVAGTEAVARACRAAGVRRLVHVSSVSVYAPAAGTVTEDSDPLQADGAGLGYEQQKLAAERIVTSAAGPGLEVVVVQPTVVYGPFGPRWTVSPLRRLAAEPGLLPSGGGGVCNAVYVDDVVAALLLAAAVPGAAGERLIVAGPAPVSWGGFYDRYRDMLRVGRSPGAVKNLPYWEQALYARQARFSSGKAGKVLGYRPTFGLDQGMARVRDWARWFGLAPAR
jgi:predicted dehydrogenase/nucleoside-diphosphate-sugar epimerase